MENELSIKISATAEKALKSIDKLIPKINKTENCVSKMLLQFDRKGQISGFTAELKDLDSEMNKVTKGSKNLKNALNLGATFAIASKAFKNGLDWMGKANEYSEALNLFNVVLDRSAEKGMRFQNIMNEAFGTNQADTLTRQGLYQSMAENMGIAQEYAYIMSETSTKLVNDISSLYNKNENVVAEALRAGVYAGQTKPLRSFGMDITEKSLQPILDEIGLKNSDGSARTVRDLSQAEKQIVRYLSVLKQSSEAHGDWANTIESPSNQLKIFNNQLVEAQRAFANLFIGTFGQILPYANAILMVIKEVSNAIATMFGIEISDYNTGGIANIEDTFADVEDSIGGATGAVKQLKREILGFDQINNINEDQGSGGGSGGGISSGGIDKKLLDAIKSYDNGMNSVRMKALDIRDRIMEWLGFTKEIDPLTGKVSFKFADTNSTLCKIVVALKNIIVNGGKAIAGVFEVLKKDFDNGIFGKAIVFALESINNVLSFVGKNKTAQKVIARILELLMGIKTLKLVPGIKQLISSIGDISKKTSSYGTILSNLIGHIRVYTNLAGKEGLTATNKLTTGIAEGTKAWQKNLSAIDKWKVALTGIATGIAGLTGITMAMEDISTSGFNMANSLGLVASGLETVTSFAMTGTAILPGWGTAIGACVGFVTSLVTALKGYKSESQLALENAKQEREEAEKNLQVLREQVEQIDQNRDANLRLIDSHQSLVNELKALVDENGNVKTGYEDRVNFILGELNSAYGTEYKLVNGQIQKYGELVNSIDTLIAKKKAQIMLEASEEKYAIAIKEKGDKLTELMAIQTEYENLNKKLAPTLETLKQKEDELSKSNSRLNELRQLGTKRTEEEKKEMFDLEGRTRSLRSEIQKINGDHRDEINTLKEKGEKLKTLEEQIGEYASYEIEYNELVIASNLKTAEEINKALESIVTATDESYSERIQKAYIYYEQLLKKQEEEHGELSDADKEYWKSSVNTITNALVEQSKTIEDLTPNVVGGWIALAKSSEEGFLKEFSKLSPDIQEQIISKMRAQGYSISSELQSGINQLHPTVKVDADLSNIYSKVEIVNNAFKNIISNVNSWNKKANGGVYSNGKWSPITQYANGGLPPMGQMFIARERGPELVGSIGRKTAVMNNNQIVESVKAGVYEAVATAMSQVSFGGGQDIRVYADEGIIVEKAVNGIQQLVNQTGELPFTVPV